MFKKYLSALFLICSLLFSIVWYQFNRAPTVTAAPTSPFIQEYPLPNQGTPRQMVYDNNTFWFTDPGSNAIGRFVYTTTIDYDFDFFNIPTANSEPYDLVVDDDIVWFTEFAGNKIGKLTISTGQIIEYQIPTVNSAPSGITVTPNGNVWFVQQNGDKLAKFNPQTNGFQEYAYIVKGTLRSGALLEDIDSTPDGSVLWFTAPGINRVGSFTLASEAFFDVTVANFDTPLLTPNQINVVNNTGDHWISTQEGRIGFYKPATFQSFRFYKVALTSLDGLFVTTQGSNQQIWFTGAASGIGGQLLVDDGSTIDKWIFPVAAPDGEVYSIAAMDDGTVWLADYANGRLIQWSPPYFQLDFATYLPLVTQEE